MIVDKDEEYRVKVRRCHETGNVVEESWYHLSGDRGRVGAPARLVWDQNTFNLTVEEYWISGGMESPLDGKIPAHTSFDPISGNPICYIWMKYGRKHRSSDLPAVELLKDGKIIHHEYWVDGILHRVKGPPIINFDPSTGIIISTATDLEKKLQAIPRGYLPGVIPR